MLPSKKEALPLFEARGHDVTDAIFADMRCSGCAAKASANLLEDAFKRACDTAHELGVMKPLYQEQTIYLRILD